MATVTAGSLARDPSRKKQTDARRSRAARPLVLAAPGSQRVVLDNRTTRVLAATIAPGEREPQHAHRWPSVMVVHRPARIHDYTGDTLTFTPPEQPSPATLRPRVSWLEPEGPHSVENIDRHPYGAFRIELKRP